MKLFNPRQFYSTAPISLACMAANLDVAFKMRNAGSSYRMRAREIVRSFRALMGAAS